MRESITMLERQLKDMRLRTWFRTFFSYVIFFGLIMSPSVAAAQTVSTDGLRLDFNDQGRLSAMSLQGQAIPLQGMGGFEIVDVAEPIDTPNLIKNPGFEDPIPLKDWAGGLPNYSSIDMTIKHSGNASVKILAAGQSQSASRSQTIAVLPERTYRVSCWRMKAPGTTNQGFYVVEQKEDGTPATDISQIGIGSAGEKDNEWEYFWKDITTGPLTKKLFIYFNIYRKDAGTIWVDDVSVNDVTWAYAPLNGHIQTIQNGIQVQSTLPDKKLKFSATVLGDSQKITVSGKIEKTDLVDRALLLRFALPFDAAGWTWHDDTIDKRVISNYMIYKNTTTTAAGDGEMSASPMTVMTDPSGEKALSMAIPIEGEPLIYKMAYLNLLEKRLIIQFSLGITSQSDKHSNNATFSFDLYSHNGNYGYRAALEKYYQIYPQYFTKRPAYEAFLNYANLEKFDSITHNIILNSTQRYDDFSDFGEPLDFIYAYHSNYFYLNFLDPEGQMKDARPTDESVLPWLTDQTSYYYSPKDVVDKLVKDAKEKITYIPDTQYWEPRTGYNHTDYPVWGLNFQVNEDPEINSALTDKVNARVHSFYSGSTILFWTQFQPSYHFLDTNNKRSGSRSIKIAIPSGQIINSGLGQTVVVLPGKTYRVGVWRRIAIGTTNAGIYVVEKKADGSNVPGMSQTFVPATDTAENGFTYFEKTFTTNSLTQKLYLYFNIWNASGAVWVDDVSVRELADGKPIGINLIKNPGFEEDRNYSPYSATITADAICGYSGRYRLDFVPDHIRVSDASLTFDKSTLKPAIYNQAKDFLKEFLWPLSESKKFLTYGNSGEWDHVFTVPYIDIGMTEGARSDKDSRMYRILSYKKIWRFCRSVGHDVNYSTLEYTLDNLLNEFMDCITYGFYPSVYALGNKIDLFRDYYRQYIPAIEELSGSGWEPIHYASTGDNQVVPERFGKYSDGSLCFSIRNYSNSEKRASVQLDAAGLGIAAGTVLMGQDLVSKDPLVINSQSASFSVTLPARGAKAYWIGSADGGWRRAIRKARLMVDRIERMFDADLFPEDKSKLLDLTNTLDAMSSQAQFIASHKIFVEKLNTIAAGMMTFGKVDLSKITGRMKSELTHGVETSLGLEIQSPRYLEAYQSIDIPVGLKNKSASPLESLKISLLSSWEEPNQIAASEVTASQPLAPGADTTLTLKLTTPSSPVRPLLPYLVKIEGISQGRSFVIYRLLDINLGAVLGDLSDDRKVSAYDAALAAKIIARGNPTADELKKGDVDEDGKINTADVVLIGKKAVGLIDKFPEEG